MAEAVRKILRLAPETIGIIFKYSVGSDSSIDNDVGGFFTILIPCKVIQHI